LILNDGADDGGGGDAIGDEEEDVNGSDGEDEHDDGNNNNNNYEDVEEVEEIEEGDDNGNGGDDEHTPRPSRNVFEYLIARRDGTVHIGSISEAI
jgi:hypothetical protein